MNKFTALILFFLLSLSPIFAEIKFQEMEFEGKVPNPYNRAKFFFDQRAYPFGVIPSDWREVALETEKKMILRNMKNPAYIQSQAPQWENIGPYNIGGRVKSIVIHPDDDNTVWIAAAAGGIWKTTDGGGSWRALFDFENSISMGALAIDEQNPNVLYCGTGEAVVGGGNIYPGSGLYKSTDGGETWKLAGLAKVEAFCKVFVHPLDSDFIIAGGIMRDGGLWISEDAGQTWEKIFEGDVTDVSINPNDKDEFFVGILRDGIWHTTDGGLNWTRKMAGIKEEAFRRFSVQAAPSDMNVVYTLFEDANSNGDARIYRSDNRGNSWAETNNLPSDFFRGQGFYNNHITIHPEDPMFAFIGGITLNRSTNGMVNTTVNMDVTNQQGEMHVDQHALAFSKMNPNLIYAGNDGGMYKSTNGGNSWRNINTGLMITQFYAMGIDYTDETIIYGGTQDNGTLGKINGENWGMIFGGDGFDVFVDEDDNNNVFGSLYYGRLWNVDFNNSQVSFITSPQFDAQDVGLWHSPFVSDRDNTFVFYLGKHGLYATYNKGNSWNTLIEPDQNQFSAVGISRADDGEYFPGLVLWAGSEIGQLYRSTLGGEPGSWEPVHQNGLVNRYITDIEPSLIDPFTCYVTLSGFGTPGVFKTTDMGESWVSISDALPDAPVNALAIHPDDENILFVANDIGVYVTYNGGMDWFPYGTGLPRSPCTDINFHEMKTMDDELILRVATHGRSMWEITVPQSFEPIPVIVSPAGGELLTGTTQFVLSWFGYDLPVNVDISFDDGENWEELLTDYNSNNYTWQVEDIDTELARIKVKSANNDEQELVSNTFSISKSSPGAIIKKVVVTFVPYGIVHDGIGSIWATSLYENKLRRFNPETFQVEKEFDLPTNNEDNRFTDITMDKENQIMYLHRMNDVEGNGGSIITVDTNGTVINQYTSPVRDYPIGLVYTNGELIAAERDGSLEIKVVDPSTGRVSESYTNPYQKQTGPRGLAVNEEGRIFQISTNFQNLQLETTTMIGMDRSNLSQSVSSLDLEDLNGPINARGIDFDPFDKQIWISELVDEEVGTIYKIASSSSVVSVENKVLQELDLDVDIYPNPASSFTNIALSGIVNGELELSITDMLGREIDRLEIQNFTGVDLIRLNCSNYNSSIYNINIYNNGILIESQKIVISR